MPAITPGIQTLPGPEDFDAFWRMVRDYGVLSLILLVFLIVGWVSALAIGVKRLHGHPAWRHGKMSEIERVGTLILGGLHHRDARI